MVRSTVPVEETPEESTPRTSASTVCGITIPVSRVRSCFETHGVNAEFTNALNNIEELRFAALKEQHNITRKEFKNNKQKFDEFELDIDLGELDDENIELINECTSLRAEELEKAVNAKNPSDDAQANLDAWNEMNDVHQAIRALHSKKYRVSGRAVVALAALCDELVHELGLHSVKNTLKNHRSNIMGKFMVDGIESLYLYPMISQLRSYRDFVASLNTPKLEDDQEVEEVHEEVDGEEILEDHHRDVNFRYYVERIVKQHIAVKERTDENGNVLVNEKSGEVMTTGTTRLTSEYKELVSNMIKELVSEVMSTSVRVLLQNNKTVTDTHVKNVVTIMMGPLGHADTTEVMSMITRRVERWSSYSTLLKENKEENTGHDLSDYHVYEVDVEVPEPPVKPTPEPKKTVVKATTKKNKTTKTTAKTTKKATEKTATSKKTAAKTTKKATEKTPTKKGTSTKVASRRATVK